MRGRDHQEILRLSVWKDFGVFLILKTKNYTLLFKTLVYCAML